MVLAESGGRYYEALLCPVNYTYGYAVIMKLRDIGYKNLYFKHEKDRFSAMYGLGEVEVAKIGFATTGQSRNQILTKLEQVIRNREIMTYSSRLYEEAKTFIWKGNKAQAQKGQHDDLMMALAIGVWLYDTSPVHSKHSYDLNKAMRDGFSVNERGHEHIKNPWSKRNYNPFKPYEAEQFTTSGSNSPYGDMSWLL